jgi:GT2 family glycosyltransferase
MSQKSVSIIIPTRDRKESLREALESLSGLSYPRDQWEVIVVDDGSVDGTDRLMGELQSRLSLPLHYHKRERRGLSSAKNFGIKQARGQILVFTDDDCILEKDWLNKLLTAFDSPEVGVAGGPDQMPRSGSFLAGCVDYSVTSFVGTGGVREGRAMRVAQYYPRGCNTAVRKSVIEEVGGFDESLIPGEDIELVYRIKQAGYGIRYVPDAFVWHKRRGSVKGFVRQIFSRGYGRVELGRRHRELFELSYLLPSFMVVGFVLLLGISLIFPFVFKGLVYLTGLYLLAIFAGGLHGAIRMGEARAFFVIPFLVILQHFSYGLGFLYGLIVRKVHA